MPEVTNDDLMDMIIADESPSNISDKIKDILYAKSADKVDAYRSNVADSMFNSRNAPTQAEVDNAPEVDPEDVYNPEPPGRGAPSVGEAPSP